jgi:dihydrodipicolinate synthase/N-acetylneuraminate lyase
MPLNANFDDLRAKIDGGTVPAMATPLENDGYRVNLAVLPQLVEFLIGKGVRGLFVGGTTGEGVLLSTAERCRLHEETVAAVGGRVPALLHVGANTTAETVQLARHAVGLGAEALVAVTPFFYPVSDDGLVAYYQAIAEAAPDTPLFAYDIPQQAVNGISPALLPRLAEEVPTLAGIKSSRSDVQLVRQLLAAAPPSLLVLAGNESAALALLALGAHGLISGLATAVPEPFVALTDAYRQGRMAEAQRQQRLINQMLALLPAGARIGAIKAILNERRIAAGPAVPPRPTPDGRHLWRQMRQLLTTDDGRRTTDHGPRTVD